MIASFFLLALLAAGLGVITGIAVYLFLQGKNVASLSHDVDDGIGSRAKRKENRAGGEYVCPICSERDCECYKTK